MHSAVFFTVSFNLLGRHCSQPASCIRDLQMGTHLPKATTLEKEARWKQPVQPDEHVG